MFRGIRYERGKLLIKELHGDIIDLRAIVEPVLKVLKKTRAPIVNGLDDPVIINCTFKYPGRWRRIKHFLATWERGIPPAVDLRGLNFCMPTTYEKPLVAPFTVGCWHDDNGFHEIGLHAPLDEKLKLRVFGSAIYREPKKIHEPRLEWWFLGGLLGGETWRVLDTKTGGQYFVPNELLVSRMNNSMPTAGKEADEMAKFLEDKCTTYVMRVLTLGAFK